MPFWDERVPILRSASGPVVFKKILNTASLCYPFTGAMAILIFWWSPNFCLCAAELDTHWPFFVRTKNTVFFVKYTVKNLHIMRTHSNYQQLLPSPCLFASCSTELSLIHPGNGGTTSEADANHCPPPWQGYFRCPFNIDLRSAISQIVFLYYECKMF